jgi:hypothetical protein
VRKGGQAAQPALSLVELRLAGVERRLTHVELLPAR